jgi:methylase of polypeptide subunit release factors
MSKQLLGLYNLFVEVFDYNATSDVVTPLELAREMVRGLPTDGTMLVPGSGIGTFAVAAVLEGRDPCTITCVEYNKAYSAIASRILNRFGINTIKDDFLSWDSEMKFDVVVGNPPFQESDKEGRKDQASNLWSKFWVKSLSLTKEDGIVSLITPTSWCSPSADVRGKFKYSGMTRLWDVFNSYSSVAQVEGVSEFFKGVGSSFGIVTVNKSGKEGLSFKEGYSTELGFLPKSNIESVSKKLNGNSTLSSNFTITQTCGKSGFYVSCPMTRKVTPESVEILKNGEVPKSGSKNPNLFLYVYVPDEEVAKKVKDLVEKNAQLLNVDCRWSGFMNIKIFEKLNYA